MIPVNEPLLDGNEKEYLAECIDTGWISSEGPFVKKFEESFARFSDCEQGIAVCNGTAALETALYGLGIEAGDEIIMPSFTIISCAIACLRLGAIPRLVDIDPETWTMGVGQMEPKVSPRTKAIMAVHIYGHPVYMDAVVSVAQKHHLKILEDCAEVHGAEYYSDRQQKWQKCGSIGHVAATSFYANKIITTGEGGMVVTSDPEIARRARDYRNLCFGASERFCHEDVGYNFRMSNLQAAVGLAQLEQIERFIDIKRSRGEYYRKKLVDVDGVRFQVAKPWAKPVYWMYSIELAPESGTRATELAAALKERGIGTRPFFRGLHTQPVLLRMGLFRDESYPNTDNAYAFGLYLPSGLALTTSQIDTVTDAIKEILA